MALDECLKRVPAPELSMVGIATSGTDIEILATSGVGQREVRFVRNAQDEGVSGHTQELFDCAVGLMQVFEHLEASRDVKRSAFKGEINDIGGEVLAGGVQVLSEGHTLRIGIESGDLEAGRSLEKVLRNESFAATGVEKRIRGKLNDPGTDLMMKPVDQLSLQWIAVRVFFEVAGILPSVFCAANCHVHHLSCLVHHRLVQLPLCHDHLP